MLNKLISNYSYIRSVRRCESYNVLLSLVHVIVHVRFLGQCAFRSFWIDEGRIWHNVFSFTNSLIAIITGFFLMRSLTSFGNCLILTLNWLVTALHLPPFGALFETAIPLCSFLILGNLYEHYLSFHIVWGFLDAFKYKFVSRRSSLKVNVAFVEILELGFHKVKLFMDVFVYTEVMIRYFTSIFLYNQNFFCLVLILLVNKSSTPLTYIVGPLTYIVGLHFFQFMFTFTTVSWLKHEIKRKGQIASISRTI